MNIMMDTLSRILPGSWSSALEFYQKVSSGRRDVCRKKAVCECFSFATRCAGACDLVPWADTYKVASVMISSSANIENSFENIWKSNNKFNLLLTESVRGRLVLVVCRGLILTCSLARAMQN